MRTLVIFSGLIAGTLITMTALEHFTRQGHLYVVLFGVAFTGYIGALAIVRKLPDSRQLTLWIVLMAVLFRLPLLINDPTLSTDIWRYLWDGRLSTHGINPYENRVDSPALDALRTPLSQRIDHQWMATPYPPVSQVVFAVVYFVFPESPTAMQAIFMLFDLACVGLLLKLLQTQSRPLKWVVLYAWNPLIVLEFAHGAHVDSMMTFFILLAFYAIHHKKTGWSAAALALATLTKFIPALLLPVLLPQWRWRDMLLYGGLVIVALLPFIGAGTGLAADSDGTGLFGAARIYALEWQTNDGLFSVFVYILDAFTTDPNQATRSLTRLLLIGAGVIILWLSWQRRHQMSLAVTAAYSAILISLYLLTVPAMFPWYLAWLLALIPLLPWNQAVLYFSAAWIYFSGAVQLSYLFYLDPESPGEMIWVRYVEYVPLYGLLGMAVFSWMSGQGRVRFQTAHVSGYETDTADIPDEDSSR